MVMPHYEPHGITLVVFDDGRSEYLTRTMQSFTQHIAYPFDHALLVNDSGNRDYAAWLDSLYPSFRRIHHPQRIGFTGAIRSAWSHLPRCKYVFTLEGDYTFNRDIDIGTMECALDTNPTLAQIVLKRQAWNDAEKQAGGIVELHPDWYEERWACGAVISEHTAFYSTNPNLMRYELTILRDGSPAWPNESESEGKFGARLREQGYSFAFLGKKFDAPLVEHIGVRRAGNGY